MKRLKLNPVEVAQELLNLNHKMIRSLQTLDSIESVDVGQTPCENLYQEDKLNLYHYPAQQPSLATPVLIVYALINRPYILDLQPDRSLIKAMTERGIPVYLIDWGYPDGADRFLDLDDYINGYIDQCVDRVLAHSRQSQLNLLGVCQGGVFSLCYSALNPDKVKNLITLVTPVDFHTPDNLLAGLAKHLDIDLAVDSYGNFPGAMLTQAYSSLMPMRLGLQKQLDMPLHLEDRKSALNFLRMERWIHDSPDLAGQAFREFMAKFFHGNQLVTGGLRINDQPVDLQAYNGPLLNLYANRDHLVPPAASKALAKISGSKDYQEQGFSGGHIGVFVGKQSQHELPDLIAQWLKQRD